MYLNQNFKKIVIIVTLIVGVVFSLGEAKNNNQSLSVDDIYVGIRHSAPMCEWTESIVTFEHKGMNLVCTLTIPQKKEKCPIIITLNGFVGTRDEYTIPGTDEGMLKRLARTLAEQGFASLRVDFRGQGDSDGEYNMTTFSTQISDALAAVEYVENQLKNQVQSNRIGIVGYSQGGLVGSCTAARDRRVDSLVLWSPVSHPPIVYEGLLTKKGIKKGLALEDDGPVTLELYVDDVYIGLDASLGKGFFEDIFNIDPLAEICNYNKPLMVIVGHTDLIVWPQPAMGQLYMNYHDGDEKLVVSEGDHDFDFWVEGPNPTKLDDSIYWTIAWFIKTLK